jgi:PTS system mannose-specific IIC component
MDILRVSLLGGLLGLDGTSVGQFMVSRPIVAGAVVGWMMGEAALGFTIGAVLELYLIVSVPAGGARFPEGATATAVAVASASGAAGAGALPLAVAVGLVWGQLGGATITGLRHVNSWLAPEPDDASHRPSRIVSSHLAAIALDFVRGAVVTGTGVWVGRRVVVGLGPTWPLSTASSMALLLIGGAVSAGILLRDLGGVRRRGVVFLAGLALGLIGARIL